MVASPIARDPICRPLDSLASKAGFGASTFSFCVVAEEASASPLAGEPPNICRANITLQAVDSKVNKYPPTTTPPTLRYSATEPRPPARGNDTREGTKKTGSHFASIPAPGVNNACRDAPNLPVVRNTASSAPQPPKGAGNEVPNLVKVLAVALVMNLKSTTAVSHGGMYGSSNSGFGASSAVLVADVADPCDSSASLDR
mmetsp:Transcript_38064/g.56640  ORF Transcript_38064/g.56640 Transcript_38064/m.56640 type:complete len:200 (+) Transcript_38064:851-1450(+)